MRQDSKSGFLMDFSNDSDLMLITFGAMGFKLSAPSFALMRATSGIAAKKLYIRDLRRAWYHQGLPGVGNSIEDIAIFLKKTIHQQKVRRVIMMGGSMGGYAALLFGWLIEADVVQTFNPVTLINPFKRLFYGDYFRLGWKLMKWKLLAISAVKYPKLSKNFFDLKTLFSEREVKTEFHIHYSSCSRSDRYHALRMNVFPNVILYEYKNKSHSLKEIMTERNYLQSIIGESLQSGRIQFRGDMGR